MDNIFQSTMSGHTAGLRVIHVAASPLITCDIDHGINEVLEDAKLRVFDYIPAVSRKRVVGIVERKRCWDRGFRERKPALA